MAKKKGSGGVTIGDVTGGIHGSIIAGSGVMDVTITLGGQPVQADRAPTVEEFKQLLTEIEKELAEITAQQEALKQISPSAPFTAQGAEQSVKDVTEKAEEPKEKTQEDAKEMQQHLTEATNLLTGILDGAKKVTEKAGDVANAVKPLAEKLEPLVEKLGVAALWAAKLWLAG